MSLKELDFVGPMQRAISAKLNAITFTYTKANGDAGTVKCFDSPPKDTQPPYICFGEPSSSPFRTKVRNGATVTFPVFCVSDYAGLKQASAIMAQVAAAVTHGKLDLAADGMVVVTFQQQSSESVKLDDVLAARIVRFTARVMEAQPQATA